jgi:predicted dehydrogenase
MNILIVGLGSIAKKHIDAIRTLKIDARIYALRSNQNAISADKIENIFSLEHFDVPLDFAIISNPTSFHYRYIEILAEKKIPLFIEKPAIHSLDNSDNLIQLVKSYGVITYVACNLRFHPCLVFLMNYLKTEVFRINEVNVYCGSYLPDWRPEKDFRKIYSANANMGGGVHLDLFHELDYTTWLFGFPNEWNSIKRNVSSLDIDAVDYANYSLKYHYFTANIVLNYYRKKVKRTIELVFENQILLVDLINNTIIDQEGSELFKINNFSINQTYKDQISYFVNCIRQNQHPMNSLKESIEVLKIVLHNEQKARK